MTNNSFIDQIAFDGMRKHLEHDFDEIYVLDLGGNVRKNPKLSGTTHNVFGIQVGVSINFFIRKKQRSQASKIYYARVDEFWSKEQKYRYLDEMQQRSRIAWEEIRPDDKHTWLTELLHRSFERFIPIGTKETKQAKKLEVETIFKNFSLGVNTARDAVVYNFSEDELLNNVKQFCNDYNAEVARYIQRGKPNDIDNFLSYEKVKWSESLKSKLKAGRIATFDLVRIQTSIYRPFSKTFLYYDSLLNDRPALFENIFPLSKPLLDNQAICVSDHGFRSMFSTMMTKHLPDLHLCASTDGFQCFPFYTYNEDGSNRRENITDWSLEEFRSHYKDKSITKWEIFYYVYAVLHHPPYREIYAANLKRELPRIPFAPDFHAFAQAGKRLAELHIEYEIQPEYPLELIESPDVPLDWRVEKMRLSKDKTRIVYNDFLTLSGIPSEAFEYRLGNRSALEWVIDQYQVSTDKRSGITNDPNREVDPQYIVRLIGQVITVSLETMKTVRGLPSLGIEPLEDLTVPLRQPFSDETQPEGGEARLN